MGLMLCLPALTEEAYAQVAGSLMATVAACKVLKMGVSVSQFDSKVKKMAESWSEMRDKETWSMSQWDTKT
jgi:hypothetical protein